MGHYPLKYPWLKKILKVHSRKVSVVGCRKLTCLAIEWIERSPLPKCQNAKMPIQNNLIKKTEAFVALAGKSAGFPLRTISFSRFDAFVMNGQSLLCIHICISSIIIFDYFWFCTFWSRWLDWIGLSPGCMLSFHASAFCTGLLSSYVFVFVFVFEFVFPFAIVSVFVLIDAIDRFALTGLSPSCVMSPHCWWRRRKRLGSSPSPTLWCIVM